jgi:poly(hydroxyalkanoate) depolymerase family esterase
MARLARAARQALLGPRQKAVAAAPLAALATPQVASFTPHHFAFEGEQYRFHVYLPALPPMADPAQATAGLPLLVMLHGCKQDATDFARGTRMNALAAKTPCLVLYPEQSAKANPLRCWNWFDSAHQGRQAGEPAMLAALTRHAVARFSVDPSRVYIAGLSAGGAMAAIVAAQHPDVYAAVGVHSGLPPGAAHDAMSAFSAMRHGGKSRVPSGSAPTPAAVPTIVFHGRADRTVHPDNAEQIVQAAVAALTASGAGLRRSDMPAPLPGPGATLRSAQRTLYSAADQRHWVEFWSVEAGPHGWSGGSADGSFTDPQGPDASSAMLAFFMQHQRG